MYLAGTVVASWFLTQDVAGLNTFAVIKNILVTNGSKFNENNLGKLNLFVHQLTFGLRCFS